MKIRFIELKNANTRVLEDINYLLPQLSSSAKKLSTAQLKRIIQNPSVFFATALKGSQIIGVGSLILMQTATGVRARIEDVVIDEKHRGEGIGKNLTLFLLKRAKKEKVRTVELSSRPGRVIANKLYQSLGFKRVDTNVYRLSL